MSRRNLIVVAVLWVVSLLAVSGFAFQQTQTPPLPPSPDSRVISGADIGFRIEGWEGSRPTGTLVIRVNGKWVEATSAKKPVLITR